MSVCNVGALLCILCLFVLILINTRVKDTPGKGTVVSLLRNVTYTFTTRRI